MVALKKILGQKSTWHDCGRLIIKSNFKSSGAPVHKLNRTLGLNGRNGGRHILGHHIAAIQQAAGHVLAVSRITLHHLIGGLERRIRDLCHSHLLVKSLLGGHNGRIGHQGKVNARVGHQICLKFSQVNIEGTIESQRGRDRAEYLGHNAVYVRVRGSLNAQVSRAYVVNGLVVDHKRAIGVLQSGVRSQYGVVGLHNRRRNLRRRINGEFQFGLLAVVHAQSLH